MNALQPSGQQLRQQNSKSWSAGTIATLASWTGIKKSRCEILAQYPFLPDYPQEIRLKLVNRFSYDQTMEMHTFSIVESGEEILTVPRLALAALAWMENPASRQVYRIVPNGLAAWKQIGEVPEAELRASLPARF